MRWLPIVLLAACNGAPASDSPYGAEAADGATCPAETLSLAALTAHNTSASPHYDRAHFAANFGTTTWIDQAGTTMAVDPDASDVSLNPVTPGHVSSVDVHMLIPSRPDLRWFAHVVPWFHTGGGNHIDIGINSNSPEQVAAMIDDMKRRGFDGMVIDWYGKDSYEDQVTKRIQQYLAATPDDHFTFVVMMDKGIANLSVSVLEQQIGYVQQQYFGDPNYEREGGRPILMFFGVTDALGATAMAQVKAATTPAVWVTQGAGALGQSWVDQAFDWAHVWHDGPSATDPYNLAGVRAYYGAVATSSKQAWGSMSSGFNGMLTKSVAWSKGKYLPGGRGACIVSWAAAIDQVIPANVTRMQWVTWNDWEEGSAIEPGAETDVAVSASLDGTTLRWQLTGDETTVDHYAVYATSDGEHTRELGTVSAGTHELALPAGCAPYQVVVVAVGKPNLRDHASNLVPVS